MHVEPPYIRSPCKLSFQTIDLIVLDVGLPDVNGFELCKTIRQQHPVPIIFLTARSDEIDRVVGLEIGADDYMVKPFSPRELTARVRAVLRRSPPGRDSPSREPPTSLFQVDAPKRRILFCGQPLSLSRYKYDILDLLISRPGRIFSREALMGRVWDQPEMSTDRTGFVSADMAKGSSYPQRLQTIFNDVYRNKVLDEIRPQLAHTTIQLAVNLQVVDPVSGDPFLLRQAIIIFYTLLLSFSEHTAFGTADLIASAAALSLITAYAKTILKSSAVAAMVGGILAILYGFLYILLQMEDYALLMGSIGLFVVLALVMFMTRKIDWYGMRTPKKELPMGAINEGGRA